MAENTDQQRKVIADAVVSMDGYTSTGPEDDMSWAMAHISSEQSEIMYEGIWRGVSTAVVGRVNWEGFTSVWPGLTSDPSSSARTRDLGNWLATVEKVVISTTLQQPDLDKTEWTNARVSRDLEAEVRSLKAAPGRDILVINSASIIKALLKADLIDELHMTVVPATLGGGVRLLPDGLASKWRLSHATTIPETSAVALCYHRP
ncbi:dihydrofolate reductase family protein [Spongiactinospora sp. TRM90649]|uniref:dihydrofolate reductase family protein n=1 Tax=Spongiactinospora sp. TRM90649 TaxID=3031114 RepID=UPI0023F9D4A6|nr:dihydrofolate reductase family protein [Spongiactinospora sp. TRM90649]MDF5757463.1 dihydrofolate reductase family protein [Spongiactinospora sp. TRM90649]